MQATKALAAAFIVCTFLLLGSVASAQPKESHTQTRIAHVRHIRREIRWYRTTTWYWQDRAGVTRTPTAYLEQRVRSLNYLRFLRRMWNHRRLHAQRLARLHPFPPHHRLWLCIHDGEGTWHDHNSGGNGHYGGLQMHPGWGYGTSYYADADSQYTQEWAAERGYRASGYSHDWLNGQWGQTIGLCWGYA